MKLSERTKVSIRPERVEFDQGSRLGEKGAHTLKAEVLEFIYMGDIFRTRLRVAGNEDFIVKTRNALLIKRVRLQPGQQIEIGWLPARLPGPRCLITGKKSFAVASPLTAG